MFKILHYPQCLLQTSITLLKVFKLTRESRISGVSHLSFSHWKSMFAFILKPILLVSWEEMLFLLLRSFPPPTLLTDPPISPRTFLQLGLSFSFPNWQLYLNWSLLHSVKLWSSLVSILKTKSSVDPVHPCLLLTSKSRILSSSFVFCYFHLLLNLFCSLASSGPVHPDTVLAKGPNNHL